jgi:hypothetical protein
MNNQDPITPRCYRYNKRKCTALDTSTKKSKINNQPIDWNYMVSASSTRNYLLHDPLIDYLNEYNITSLDKIPGANPKNNNTIISIENKNKTNDIFVNYIMNAGVEFENELIKLIEKSHKVITVANYRDSKNIEKYKDTIELMKKGEPIIYQGILHNYENYTFGTPDLIVRSDYVNKLMNNYIISDEEANISSPKLGIPYHYKIIDIKHSNIPLRADGIHILNSDSIPAYKGQLYIYTIALNKILGININKAYIWGKQYTYESSGVKFKDTNFLNRLGIIDYDTVDYQYVQQTANAIKWMQDVKNNSSHWQLLPLPNRWELFPNMKNEHDGKWHSVKCELNNKINEITNIWNCGIKHREHAHNNNIFKWSDPKCSSKNMGFNPGRIATTVDKILDINRNDAYIIKPNKILYDRDNWKETLNDTQEFYLDFETLQSNFGSIIKDGFILNNSESFIFMIGIGYSKKGKWIFKTFIMKNKTAESEIEMFNNFIKYISTILKQENKTKAKLYHWSFAEVSIYNKFKCRNPHNIIQDKHISFYDLNKVFINEPITILGAFNFSLKTVANALHSHNLIKSCWDTKNKCSNGLMVMILANELYDNKNTDIYNNPLMKDIINYNEIDCKVLFEIHELIRNTL